MSTHNTPINSVRNILQLLCNSPTLSQTTAVMKTFSIAIVAALVASAVASPAVEAHSRRTITTKVTLCEEANLHNCDDTFIPIDTCCKSDVSSE